MHGGKTSETVSSISYDFAAPSRIVFGWGRRREAGSIARSLGTRAFVICGSRTLEQTGGLDEILNSLHEAAVETVRAASISREPLVEDVDECVAALHAQRAGAGDLLLAVGGGSAIDLAKAVGALVTQEPITSVRDYLEGVGTGRRIVNLPLPMLAMPTTAGTGSEATKNAVISSNDPPFKKSLRSDQMVPRAVLIDPELAVSVPPQITAWTGMDAITQLIESYISRRATRATREIAGSGIACTMAARSPWEINAAEADVAGYPVVDAFHDGQSRPAREKMAHAAMLSGLALANSGLGMAHGVAAALGIHCNIPHGLACAVMLPEAMRTNFALPWGHNLDFEYPAIIILGRELWQSQRGSIDTKALRCVERIEALLADLKIPLRLSQIGVRREQIPAIVRDSRGNSMSANPRVLSDEELTQILENML